MSELEDIAANVDTVAGEIGTVIQQLTAQAVRNRQTAAQANAALAGSADPRPKQVTQQLDTAAQRCEQAAQALQLAQQAAKQFVGRIVGGGGGGGGNGAQTTPSTSGLLSQVSGWIGEINPGQTDDPFDPRSNNCGQCALAVFQRLSGSNTSATAGLGTLTIAEMEAATGRPQIHRSPESIAAALREMGPGSHAVVGIDRDGAPGHWFNALFDGDRVVAIDGQSGEILDWPPAYGSSEHPVIYWDSNV